MMAPHQVQLSVRTRLESIIARAWHALTIGLTRVGAFSAILILAAPVSSGPPAAAENGVVYYVDAETGSDDGGGRSPEEAWRSLDRVKAARFKPGDTVLFRRGGVWSGGLILNDSGAEGLPITLGAYGQGAAPVLRGARNGVQGNGNDHIVIEDIAFKELTGGGIVTFKSKDWTIRRVTIEEVGTAYTGDARTGCGIQWWHGKDLSVIESTFRRVTGDGIWIWQADGVKLVDNRIEVVQGGPADNVHIHGVRDFEIRGNYFSMEGGTNSGKGNLLLSYGERGLIANNTFIGGNFGASGTFNDTVIQGNRFLRHKAQSWSAAILMGDWDGWRHVSNVSIRDNFFQDSRTGVAMLDVNKKGNVGAIRENIVITSNIFDVLQAAVAVNSNVTYSGSFTNNIIVGLPSARWTRTSGKLLNGQKWIEARNSFVTLPPPWKGGAEANAGERTEPGGPIGLDRAQK